MPGLNFLGRERERVCQWHMAVSVQTYYWYLSQMQGEFIHQGSTEKSVQLLDKQTSSYITIIGTASADLHHHKHYIAWTGLVIFLPDLIHHQESYIVGPVSFFHTSG